MSKKWLAEEEIGALIGKPNNESTDEPRNELTKEETEEINAYLVGKPFSDPTREREERERQREHQERIKQIECEYPVSGRTPKEGELVFRPTLQGAGAFAGCDEYTPQLYGNYVKYKKKKS